jgi:hypothetical protein
MLKIFWESDQAHAQALIEAQWLSVEQLQLQLFRFLFNLTLEPEQSSCSKLLIEAQWLSI